SHDSRDGYPAATLIHLDFGHQGAVAVVALVENAGDAPAGGDTIAALHLGRCARLPSCRFRGGIEGVDQTGILKVVQPVLDRISPPRRSDLVDEALVGKRVLQSTGRSQGGGEERRCDHPVQYSLAGDRPGATALVPDTAGAVRRVGISIVAVS